MNARDARRAACAPERVREPSANRGAEATSSSCSVPESAAMAAASSPLRRGAPGGRLGAARDAWRERGILVVGGQRVVEASRQRADLRGGGDPRDRGRAPAGSSIAFHPSPRDGTNAWRMATSHASPASGRYVAQPASAGAPPNPRAVRRPPSSMSGLRPGSRRRKSLRISRSPRTTLVLLCSTPRRRSTSASIASRGEGSSSLERRRRRCSAGARAGRGSRHRRPWRRRGRAMPHCRRPARRRPRAERRSARARLHRRRRPRRRQGARRRSAAARRSA